MNGAVIKLIIRNYIFFIPASAFIIASEHDLRVTSGSRSVQAASRLPHRTTGQSDKGKHSNSKTLSVTPFVAVSVCVPVCARVCSCNSPRSVRERVHMCMCVRAAVTQSGVRVRA